MRALRTRYGFVVLSAAVVLYACAARTLPADVICGSDQVDCGGSCATLSKDPTNCGACGGMCPGGTVCFQGTCTTSCGPGTIECGQSCVDPKADHDNCGGCGHACTQGQACAGGICGYACPPGQTLCDGQTCESLASDPANCGACGAACDPAHGAGVCVEGKCRIGLCAAGYGDCDADPSDGCEVDFSDDPANCGRCGHDCCGGQCVSGQCQPRAISLYSASYIAVDASDLYWSYGTLIFKCAKSGCNVPTLVAQSATSAAYLLVDATNLYWDEAQSVMTCSKASCATSIVTLASGSWTPSSLAVDSTTVYWTTYGTSGSVLSCPIAGCTTPTVIASGQFYAGAIALDSAAIYWQAGGAIERCPKTNCTTPQAVVAGGNSATQIAIDGQELFFSSGGVGFVARCDWSSCGQTLQFLSPSGESQMSGDFAVDGTNVFWPADDMLLACAKTGCNHAPTTLATVDYSPQQIAADDHCIYFTPPYGYTRPILAVAKP